MAIRLPPYQERPDEDLIAKCARLRRELQAAAQPEPARACNDNEAERECRYWWNKEDER